MRKILLLIFFAVAASLPAGEQTVRVTPHSLHEWTVVGAEAGTLAQAQPLTLPAGAQLARTFPAGDLVVKLVTQPVFDADPADWPVLEIGGAALVFQGDGTNGKLALALGDNAPVALPFAIALGPDGRSREPLVVVFTRRLSVITVNVAGQTAQFPVVATAVSTQEVVASAGASEMWPLENFAVIVTTPDEAASADGGKKKPAEENASVEAGLAASATRGRESSSPPENDFPLGPKEPFAAAVKSMSATLAAGANTSLEVFTPPSVRHGRADALRVTAAKPLQP